MKYELIESKYGSYVKCITSEGIIMGIPTDEENSDYQAYLESLSK